MTGTTDHNPKRPGAKAPKAPRSLDFWPDSVDAVGSTASKHSAHFAADNAVAPKSRLRSGSSTQADPGAPVQTGFQLDGNGYMDPLPTVLLPRYCLFEPTFTPHVRDSGWMDFSDGRCRVKGRLGQRHEELIDAVMHHVEPQCVIHDAKGVPVLIEVTCKANYLRSQLSTTHGRYSYKTMFKLLDDLTHARLWVDVNDRESHLVVADRPLLESYDSVTQHAADRQLRFRFGEAFLVLCGCSARDAEVLAFHDPVRFSAVPWGLPSAVARYILSHASDPVGGWRLDDVIEAVTPGGIVSKNRGNWRRAVRDAAGGLITLGIAIDGNRLHRIARDS